MHEKSFSGYALEASSEASNDDPIRIVDALYIG